MSKDSPTPAQPGTLNFHMHAVREQPVSLFLLFLLHTLVLSLTQPLLLHSWGNLTVSLSV